MNGKTKSGSWRRAGRFVATLTPLILCTMFVAALIGAREATLLQPAELGAYDVFVRLREAPRSKPDVVMISVDDRALDEWGWPIPDGRLGQLIDAAAGAGAQVIALDIFRDRPVGAGHEELVAVLESAPVYGAMKFSDNTGVAVPPPPVLKKSGRFGVIDVPVDDDGVVRRSLLYVDDGKTVYSGLALKATLAFLKSRGIRQSADPEDKSRMLLGSASLGPLASNAGPYQAVDSRGYQILLDFRRSHGDFTTIDAHDLLAGNVQPELLADKIVFIGIASELVKDFIVTPRSGATASGILHGVAVHAWLSDQLIRLSRGEAIPLDTLTPDYETAIIAAAGIAGLGFGLAIASPLVLVLAGIALTVAAIGGSFVLFEANIWVPVVPGTVAALGCLAIAVGGRASVERRQRQALMELFSQQVSAEVADDLWRRRDLIFERGLPRPLNLAATVMFMDLAGSTSIADRLDAEAYMSWVGRFLEQMAQTALDCGGMVDKYTGDGLMVVFGVPVPRMDPEKIEADACAAVACALAMARTLGSFNAECPAGSDVKARMRIGIHSGSVFAGCVGARARAQYTVMGSAVNAAARLEGLKELEEAKDAGDADCRILISEATAAMLNKQFMLRTAGSVILRGFSEPTSVYLVEGAAEGANLEVG